MNAGFQVFDSDDDDDDVQSSIKAREEAAAKALAAAAASASTSTPAAAAAAAAAQQHQQASASSSSTTSSSASSSSTSSSSSSSAAPTSTWSSPAAHRGIGSSLDVDDDDSIDDLDDDERPMVILMGLRRSGKTSIQKVVFSKLSPNESIFLEATNAMVRSDIANSSFVQLSLLDTPGSLDVADPAFDVDGVFSRCGAVVFVLDAQDDYADALAYLHLVVTEAVRVNPRIHFEVFVHKVDGVSDEHKTDTLRDVRQQAQDELDDARLEGVEMSFYLTSIYDHSIFEAFSKVTQKLIKQLTALESLLNILVSNCRLEKSFLIDVVSKIYVATDFGPIDMQTYELCCDMIDVVVDISCIYGMPPGSMALPYDRESESRMRLDNGTVLVLREVNRYLALVVLVRESNYTSKHGLVAYNFSQFRVALHEIMRRSRSLTRGPRR